MTCAELVADPTYLNTAITTLANCMEANGAENCQGGAFVGFDFTSSGTATLLSVFLLERGGGATAAIEEAHFAGTLDVESADVWLAYGQRSEEFEDLVTDKHLQDDMVLVQASMLVSLIFLLLHTHSLFVSLVGLVQVALSFPIGYFFVKLVCGFEFFPFLNFLGLFVIMGIGVDDVFVVVDKWSQATLRLPKDAAAAEIAEAVGPDTAFTMLLTSITTAAAFFATSTRTSHNLTVGMLETCGS